MELKYIDIHGHVNFAAYDGDREATITRAGNAGVGMIAVGTDLVSSTMAVELASKYDNVWATVGMHPIVAGESRNDPLETGRDDEAARPAEQFDEAEFLKLAAMAKVVAIGECGLDYFHSKPEDMEAQRQLFASHIKVANTVGKPLMLHVRNSKTGAAGASAYAEAVEILKVHAKVPANFHFFAGTEGDLRLIAEHGHSVSFTGVITFSRDYDIQVRSAPMERIMAETDCPYVSPVPYRGKRNEPLYVAEVVKKLAEIRGHNAETIRKAILENSRQFFKI